MNNQIKEIQIINYPCIIFSDSHTNLSNIRKLKKLYPDFQLLSLGDFTFLFEKEGQNFNKLSIQYFIDNNILAVCGNHEAYLIASENNDKFVTQRVLGNPPQFNLSKEHLQFLDNLPRGFKLILSNGLNYYCFHNLPRDLWSFPDNITEQEFKSNYVFDSNTIGIIQGHLHKNKIDNFNPKRYIIGELCNSSNGNGNNYILITENGIEYKKLQ